MPPPYDLLAHNNFVCDSDLIKEHTSVNPIRLSEAETTYFDRFSIDDLKLKGYDEILYIYKHAAIDNQLNLLPFRREFKFVDAYFRQGIVQIYKRELMGELGSEYHPGGICIPGLRKLFVSVDGNLFPCEKCNHANKLLCIGSVYHGLDYRKIANLINKYLELCPDDCINCWVAGAFCSICYAFAEEADGSSFSPDRKRRACNACRNTCHNNLVLCYSILERNSKAFDFIRRIEIKKD